MSSSLKALRTFACVLTLSLAAGCADACMNLASQICSCQLDDNSKAACNQQAKQAERVFAVGPEDEAKCQDLLDSKSCDCNKLNTEDGRRNCGLAVNP